MRVVHYLNQFFAGLGGEDQAGTPPTLREEPIGPGRRLQALIGEHEIVATVFCGDDYAAGTPGAAEQILALARSAGAELIVAGPAFTSGRYGLACASVVAAAAREGLPALASMHPENPGIEEAAGAPVIESGATGREMAVSLERLAAATVKLAAGEPLGAAEGRVGKLPRRNVQVSESAAARAVELALARLGGDREATEIPLPSVEHITPAAPIADPGQALIAILTEGGLVPAGNPDRLESARATKWVRYEIAGLDSANAPDFQSVHGGFATTWANEDPNRMLPLDVARELEREGAIGRLHSEYFSTAGNGTPVASAKRFGIEWAAELHKANVAAVVLTAT